MGRVSKSYCNRLIDNGLDDISKSIKKIDKNYNDMDLKNASVSNEIEAVLAQMKDICNKIGRELSNCKSKLR